MNTPKKAPPLIESDYLRGQAQAARYARVSPRCISEWQARRLLAYHKIGRKIVVFRKADIDAVLAQHRVPAIGGETPALPARLRRGAHAE